MAQQGTVVNVIRNHEKRHERNEKLEKHERNEKLEKHERDEKLERHNRMNQKTKTCKNKKRDQFIINRERVYPSEKDNQDENY